MPIICDGCGQPLRIPPGYSRNKIRCACGVYCAVPEAARAQAEEAAQQRPAAASRGAPAVEEQAENWLLNDDPPALGARTQPRSPSEPPRSRDVDREEPAIPEKEPVWCPSVDDFKEEEEEDSSPYAVEGADEVPCPKCCLRLPPGSVLCIRCGYHLKKRKKIAKTYQPIERVWETNASLKGRRLLFGICSVAFFVSGLIGTLKGGVTPSMFVFTYIVITTMGAFLLGTFDRIHLIRDTRGRVELTKTWRICFFARPPQRVDVRSYEGIVTGRRQDVSSWDYLLLFILLGAGIVPGIIWYYFVFYKLTFHVSLSRDHGFPEYIVYSGWSETVMKEIAYTLRDAARLRYDES